MRHPLSRVYLAAMPLDVTREIERAAKQAGITERKDLAVALGISKQLMSDLMNGNRRWTSRQLENLIAKLKVPPATAKRWHKECAVADGWKI